MKYVALLRGINVGGKNLIKMVELKECFEKMGLENVSTYIASGNVIFESPETDLAKLTERIEKTVSKQFNYKSCVVVVSHEELKHAVEKAPKGFGTEPKKYRYDVIFLRAPMTVGEAMKSVEMREGVDEVWQGKDVLYFSRVAAKAVYSKLPKLASMPAYKSMTIRNWNTTTKLLALMEAQ
jgi:uncharacterized protein (DUF1697 family)